MSNYRWYNEREKVNLMKIWKTVLQESFLVMGILFVLTLLISTFFNEPEMLVGQESYYLIFFVAYLLVRYISIKLKKGNKEVDV